MKRLTLLLAGIMTTTLLAFSAALPMLASADIFEEACTAAGNNNPSNSTVCKDKGSSSDPVSGSGGVIMKVSGIIAILGGVLAVIMIIVAGIKMATSGGDANKVKEARTKIVHALIGLAVIALAEAIIAFVVNKVL